MPEQLRPESKDLGEAATFIPDSSFKRAFETQSREGTPHGLTPFSLCYNKTICESIVTHA